MTRGGSSWEKTILPTPSSPVSSIGTNQSDKFYLRRNRNKHVCSSIGTNKSGKIYVHRNRNEQNSIERHSLHFTQLPNNQNTVWIYERSPSLLSSTSKTHTEMSTKSPMKKLNLNSSSSFGHPTITKITYVKNKKRIIKDPMFNKRISHVINTHTKEA